MYILCIRAAGLDLYFYLVQDLWLYSIFIFLQTLLLFFALYDIILYLSQVGFFNLVKRARDQMNHLWVAEASENSSYSVYSSLSTTSHLYKTGECAQKWAKISCSVRSEFHNLMMVLSSLSLSLSLYIYIHYINTYIYISDCFFLDFGCMQTIQKLRERVLCIIQGH